MAIHSLIEDKHLTQQRETCYLHDDKIQQNHKPRLFNKTKLVLEVEDSRNEIPRPKDFFGFRLKDSWNLRTGNVKILKDLEMLNATHYNGRHYFTTSIPPFVPKSAAILLTEFDDLKRHVTRKEMVWNGFESVFNRIGNHVQILELNYRNWKRSGWIYWYGHGVWIWTRFLRLISKLENLKCLTLKGVGLDCKDN